MAYTPFLAQAGATIGQALESRGLRQQKAAQDKLAGSAYMGDPRAMEELMQVNPQLGAQIFENAQKRKDSAAQKDLQKRVALKKEVDSLTENIGQFDTYEDAKKYADPIYDDLAQRFPELAPKEGGGLTQEGYSQARQIAGEGDGGAFGGTGMEAQTSNMLVKGVEDPEFRSSPEYARAYQLATEAKVIRTPTGDILHRPELSPIFKPPGEVKTDEQQIQESKAGVKEDVERIKGTEKEIITTADEKKSVGFHNRMVMDEENITKLGQFDSAGYWERFKGITNITASPELQKYRQAAGDWIRAKLRMESGAVIADEEMASEFEVYYPQIGDSQSVMDQKKRGRAEAMNAMKIAAGKAYKEPKKTKEGVTKKTDIPAVGTEQGGYRFIGGDPSKQESWEQI